MFIVQTAIDWLQTIIDFVRHHAKISIDFVTLLLAILAFFRAMYVYRQQKRRDHELAAASDRLKRFEKFQEMQKRFRARAPVPVSPHVSGSTSQRVGGR
jgi:hypothetical protein